MNSNKDSLVWIAIFAIVIFIAWVMLPSMTKTVPDKLEVKPLVSAQNPVVLYPCTDGKCP